MAYSTHSGHEERLTVSLDLELIITAYVACLLPCCKNRSLNNNSDSCEIKSFSLVGWLLVRPLYHKVRARHPYQLLCQLQQFSLATFCQLVDVTDVVDAIGC